MTQLNQESGHPIDPDNLGERVKKLSAKVQKKYADYKQLLDDDASPGSEERLKNEKHDLMNAINSEELEEQARQREQNQPAQQPPQA